MGRPKFRITVDNLMHAARYLDGRLGSQAFVPFAMSPHEARMYISELLLLPKSVERAEKLQVWCDANLDSKTTHLLKTAVRKRRQRATITHRVVTISDDAYQLLKELANRKNTTLSKALHSSILKSLRSR